MFDKPMLTAAELQVFRGVSESFITQWTSARAAKDYAAKTSTIPSMPVVRPSERGMLFPVCLFDEWLLRYFGTGDGCGEEVQRPHPVFEKPMLTAVELLVFYGVSEQFITLWTSARAVKDYAAKTSTIPAVPVVRCGERGMLFPRQIFEGWLLRHFGSGYGCGEDVKRRAGGSA